MNEPATDIVSAYSEDDSYDTIGGRISRARDAAGFSPAQLARRLGIKTATLSSWENDRSEPRSNKLVMLSGVLNVSPSWLIMGEGEAPKEEEAENDNHIESLRYELIQLHKKSQEISNQIQQLLAKM